MNDPDRIALPDSAARILLGAETVIENGDRLASYTSLAEAWRDLAASIRGE